MISIRQWIVIGGMIVMILGLSCLPLAGVGIRNSKRHMSLFDSFADLGAFFQTGLILMSAGATIIAITGLFSLIEVLIRRRAKSRFKQDTENERADPMPELQLGCHFLPRQADAVDSLA